MLATITTATTNSTTTILFSKNHNKFSFHKSSQFCLRPTMRECNAFPAESRGFPSNLISDLIYVRNATVASELDAFSLKQLFVLYYCFIQFHRSLFTFHLKQLFALLPISNFHRQDPFGSKVLTRYEESIWFKNKGWKEQHNHTFCSSWLSKSANSLATNLTAGGELDKSSREKAVSIFLT